MNRLNLVNKFRVYLVLGSIQSIPKYTDGFSWFWRAYFHLLDFFFYRHQSNQAKTEKTRSVLQKYMDAVLSDDRLNQSEIVYSFLSPSPDYLKKSANEKSSSKNLRDQKFHLSNFFKSTDLDHELSNRVINEIYCIIITLFFPK